MAIYVNQPFKVEIHLDSPLSLSGANVVGKSISPSGTEKNDHTTAILDAENKIIQIDLASNELNEAGVWKFWVVVDQGGLYPSTPVDVRVFEEGTE